MQRNISKIESSHPDIICPPGKSPGAQVKYCSLKCCLPYITYIYFLKYQSSDCLHWVKPEFWLQDPTWGDVWAQHQMCSSPQGIASLAPKIHHCMYFVHRRAVPVPLWWCLAQSLTSPTQRQTARAKGEIFSLLERKGLKPFSLVHLSSVVCFLI